MGVAFSLVSPNHKAGTRLGELPFGRHRLDPITHPCLSHTQQLKTSGSYLGDHKFIGLWVYRLKAPSSEQDFSTLFIHQKHRRRLSNTDECIRELWYIHTMEYGCPSNNVGIRGTDPLCSRKPTYKFPLPKNLTTNSLPLTRSLTDNIDS